MRGCSSVDRVLASEAKGRGFDPRQPRQLQVQAIRPWTWLKTPMQAFHHFGA